MISEELQKSLAATAPTTTDAYRSGVHGLDILLGDGLQSGQTMEWVGSVSCGKTGVLREIVRSARKRGVAVAWVDTAHELMAADWIESLPGRLWVIRPLARDDALFCVEVMLRTQSFGLVILDGLPPLRGNRGVRLQRLARQSGTSLILLRETDSKAMGGRVHGRLNFDARVVERDGPLARRSPFSWSLQITSAQTAAPSKTQQVHMVEGVDQWRVLANTAADRPSGRTSVGQRYGR